MPTVTEMFARAADVEGPQPRGVWACFHAWRGVVGAAAVRRFRERALAVRLVFRAAVLPSQAAARIVHAAWRRGLLDAALELWYVEIQADKYVRRSWAEYVRLVRAEAWLRFTGAHLAPWQ